MYYPVRLLERGLEDVRATKSFIKSQLGPGESNSEIVKIDLVILDLKAAIQKLENDKPKMSNDDCEQAYLLTQQGKSVRFISSKFNVSDVTLRRAVAKYRAMIWKETGIK